MIIQNGMLLFVSESDLDANGVLRIPYGVQKILEGVGNSLSGIRAVYFPDTMKKISASVFNYNPSLKEIYFGNKIKRINYGCFQGCQNIKIIQIPRAPCKIQLNTFENLEKIIQRDDDGISKTYTVKKYSGIYYHEIPIKSIGKIKLSQLYRIDLTKDFLLTKPKICISIKNKATNFFISENLKEALLKCRKHMLIQSFNYQMWKYKATHNTDDDFERYELILCQALYNYLQSPYKKKKKDFFDYVKQYTNDIPKNLQYLKKFFTKYPGLETNFDELLEITCDKLIKKITPIRINNPINRSCTRWLKRHPVTPQQMYAIICAGYKNPGSFPYSWLKKIPNYKRGNATIQLHKLFKNATMQMYSPDNRLMEKYLHINILNQLSSKISKIIHQELNIKYLDSGNFSKTYTLQIPGDKIYVWKIYHCDNTEACIKAYQHDTELQNSFLVSGKKYYGNIKFRKILTAGLSNQRGEIYLIYPYTNNGTGKENIHRTFEFVRKYSLLDNNAENIIGNTIIDVGALRINYKNWYQPKYVSKITNTILYQSWNDLGYVLNNYTSRQIHDALNFIDGKISVHSLEFGKVQSKIEFLRNKTRIR